MTDYFAVLQQPPRPWLDPDQLKEKQQELASAAHPDRKDAGESTFDFAVVNEAYRVLSNPRLRLQHLLSLEGRTASTDKSAPGELLDLFSETGSLLHEMDGLLRKLKTTTNALSRSLLQSEVVEIQKRSDAALAQLREFSYLATQDLRKLDAVWDNETQRPQVLDQLDKLSQRFAFLTRWIEQLEERCFQLSL